MPPKIENPVNLALTPATEAVLRRIFARYSKVILKKEFSAGLSGGRVFEVRPIRPDGAPELPTVVKLAPISLIEQEWRAYQRHVYNRLPRISQLTSRPVVMQRLGLGGLRYAMGGDGAFEVMSLREYYSQPETTVEKLQSVLGYLFRIMDHVWAHHRLCERFHLRSSYDQVLPVNLLINPLVQPEPPLMYTVSPSAFAVDEISLGDAVQLRGFVVHKVNYTTQTVTLRSPNHSPELPSYFVRSALAALENEGALTADQVLAPISGEVVETRTSRLAHELRASFGVGLDPHAAQMTFGQGVSLPNPLLSLPRLLNQTRPVHIATIHGDLNLENILIEPETGAVSLIDFADVREDHVLHDLLRLETEVITQLLPELVVDAQLSLAPTLATLYWQLYTERTGAFAADGSPHRALQKVWVMMRTIRRIGQRYLLDPQDWSEYDHGLTLYLLGALKLKNLNQVSTVPLPKQAAFLAAALTDLLASTTPSTAQPPPALAPLLERQTLLTVDTPTPTPQSANGDALSLPLQVVPPLGPLPKPLRMLYDRNPRFVGRVAELKQLANLLQPPGSAVKASPTVVVTGLGGLGKSQLAVEFAHRYGRFFPGGLFWLSFADPRAVPAEVADCGAAMDLRPDFDQLPLEERCQLVRAAWERGAPKLLIFDNCEDPALLAAWRPTHNSCLLITSRRADWQKVERVQTLPLDVLRRAESIELLREHRPDADGPLLEEIAQEVGDLPLALHLAGSYLARYRQALDADHYLAQLRSRTLLAHDSLLSGSFSPTGHEQNVSRTIAVSFHRLNPSEALDQVALEVLARAACLAPGEPIPLRLLTRALHEEGEIPPSQALDQTTEALQRLEELGLVRLESGERIRLHRLVVAYIEQISSDVVAQVRPALEVALCSEAEQLNAAGYPAALLAWQAHLRTLVNTAYYAGREDELAARLYHALGEHFRQIGEYERARICLTGAVQVREQVWGQGDERTARTLTDLGLLFFSLEDLDKAQSYYERALAIQEQRLAEHADTALTLNHLGLLLQYRGDLDKAEPCHRRALAIRRKVLGARHTLIAHSLCNLAYIAYRRSDFVNARAYLEEALLVQTEVLGLDHPETARVLTNLGELLQAQGAVVEAQRIYEQVLRIQRQTLAKDHPDNARVFNNLGEILCAQGQWSAAQSHLEWALAIRQKILGDKHTGTGVTLNNLGELAQAQGNECVAHDYYGRAYAILNARLGPEHYRTQRVVENLATLNLPHRSLPERA
jgi:tetratricopeptide (TPR) repeat protein/serine/threonine protein kinase